MSEDVYRDHYLKQDRAQCRRVVRIVMWTMVPLLYVDFSFHGASAWWAILCVARLSFMLCSRLFLGRLNGVETPAQLERRVQEWLGMAVLVQLASDLSLPRDYFGHYSIDVLVALLVFIVLPVSRRAIRPLVAVYLTGLLGLLFYKTAPVWAYIGSAGLMLLAAATTGHAISGYVHRYRRRILSAEQEIERQAGLDPLTGVPNRREFLRMSDAELQRHLRAGKPLSLMVLDLQQLSRINQDLGYQAGDVVVMEVTRRIRRATRQYDHLARYGHDEFCVLLPEAAEGDAHKIASRAHTTIQALPVAIGGREVRIQARVGIATLQQDDTVASLLARAASALCDGLTPPAPVLAMHDPITGP